MTRKQVLVQLDDSLVERLDVLADRQGVSRSELLRRGAVAVLAAAEAADDDAAFREAYRRQPQDLELIEASTRMAAETAPEW